MSVYYYGSHSITFTKIVTGTNTRIVKNSWVDFHLIPSTRPYLAIPKINNIFVKLPRSNKVLDLTNSLTKSRIYEGSYGSWEFYLDTDQWNSWAEAIDELEDFFDGSEFEICFNAEPNRTYSGIIFISNYSPEDQYSKIKLDYDITWNDITMLGG